VIRTGGDEHGGGFDVGWNSGDGLGVNVIEGVAVPEKRPFSSDDGVDSIRSLRTGV
jgi:hypothetical protein